MSGRKTPIDGSKRLFHLYPRPFHFARYKCLSFTGTRSVVQFNLGDPFHQMDLIESQLFTSPMILLQTVMEEVRHRSLPLYNRLKALTKLDEKKMWTFYNEYCS